MVSITLASIAAAVATEIPAIFDDALSLAIAGEGSYLATGSPSSIPGKISQAAGRSACRIYGSGSVELSASAATRYESACRPYLASLGAGAPAELKIPFSGGQCAGVFYQFKRTGANSSGTPLSESQYICSGQYGGPLSVEKVEFNNGASARFEVVSRLANGSIQRTVLFQGPNTPQIFATIKDVVRCDGLADTCGNPPPEVKQPAPGPDGSPPPFRFNPDPGLSVDIDVDLNPDGSITFDIGTGDITIDPFPDGDGGGGGGGVVPTPRPGAAGASSDTGAGAGGEGGSAEGEAPEGKVLTGVKVSVLAASPDRRRYTKDVDRGVAYVYMGTPTEGLGLEPTGATLRDGQFFFAQKDYLTSWRVTARLGYNLRITPYYKDKAE